MNPVPKKKKTVAANRTPRPKKTIAPKPYNSSRLNLNQPINFILKDQRIRKELERTALAKSIGISRNHLYEIEEGSGMPSFEILTKWARELGLQVTLKAIPYVPLNPRGKHKKKKVKVNSKKALYSKVKLSKLKK